MYCPALFMVVSIVSYLVILLGIEVYLQDAEYCTEKVTVL